MVLGYLYWIWDHFAPVIFGLAGGIGYGLLLNYKNFDWKSYIPWPFIGSGVGATYIPFGWAGIALSGAAVFFASLAENVWGFLKKFITPVTPVEKVAAPLVMPKMPETLEQAIEQGEEIADITILDDIAGLIERRNKQCQLHPNCSGCPHILSNPSIYGTTCDYMLSLQKMIAGTKGDTVRNVLEYQNTLIAHLTAQVQEVKKQAKTWLYRGIAGALVSWFLYRGLVAILQFVGITLPF